MNTIWVTTFLYLMLLIDENSAFGNSYWKFRHKLDKIQQRKGWEHVQNQKQHFANGRLPIPENFEPYEDQFYEQPLDHFDPMVKDTYKQRYWVNTDFWAAPHGPVFLYIGGEGALTSLTVQAGEHVDLAKKYKAIIFAVEHRYYGESINPDGLKLENIKYLSSQQALADLARFHEFASSRFTISSTNVWVCFGGSYPGALSAWFRVKYPHLVYGAIASSAPVKAKVNFEGYNDVVASSLSDPIVNGSAKCAINVKQAFKQVDLLLAKQQLQTLSADFLSCQPLTTDPYDLYMLASNLADVFMGTVQYNDESPGLTVDTLCQGMTQSGSPYDNLIILNKKFLNASDQNCTDNSWQSFIKQINDTSEEAIVGVGMRQWIYQTCTQFGYYQTCDDNTTCLFSEHLDLSPNLDICRQLFNITPSELYGRVRFTNDYYGADQPRGTRIVFVNGSIDPWHALSVLKDLSPSEIAIFIPGTAHCANMDGDNPSDPPALKLAKQKIDLQIGEWLEEAGYMVQQPRISVQNSNSIRFQKL